MIWVNQNLRRNCSFLEESIKANGGAMVTRKIKSPTKSGAFDSLGWEYFPDGKLPYSLVLKTTKGSTARSSKNEASFF